MANRKFGFTLLPDARFDSEIKRLKATPEAIEKAIREELIVMAVDIRNRIIKSMRKSPKIVRINPKTGRGCWWISGGKVHTPSSPGYAPRVDTGDLIKSIKMDVGTDQAEVGSNLQGKDGKYPVFLEYGTKNMEARPWLEPAFDGGKRLFYSTIRNNILRAIRNT